MPLMMIAGPGPRYIASAGSSNTPFASQYPLEILYPKAVAAAPSGLDANNRCFFAYTGLTYTIRAAAMGGSYPYTWSLSNAPAGMSINSSTGVITWTNPTATASNIQVTCSDSASGTASETWSITVGTSGWYFVDAVNGNAHSTNGGTGTGTAANPWLTLDDVYDGSTANSRVYFRAGTYTVANIPTFSNSGGAGTPYELGEEYIDWRDTSRATNWIAYPGDAQPVIDYGYIGTGFPYNTGDSKPRVLLQSNATALIGLKFINSMTMAFQFARTNRRGVYVWDCDFVNTGPGINGGNSAFLMWKALYGSGPTYTPGTQAYGDVVIGCLFNDCDGVATTGGNSVWKMYSMLRPLFYDNDISDTTENVEACAYKADISQFTIRKNQFSNIGETAISGNMDTHLENDGGGEETFGDICYNYVADAVLSGLDIGNAKVSTPIGRVDVYRNTFVCPIRIENLVTADGPYVLSKNAIQNADGAQSPWPHIQDTSITDSSRVTLDDNTAGASGIVDGSGNLIDTSKLGTHGHVIP
jgi:hypothetical protein